MQDDETKSATLGTKYQSSLRPTRATRPTALRYEALLRDADATGDRYRPLGLLGSGGMGEVHRSIDARCEREIAIKRIHPACDETQRRRFLREARIQAQLDHPTVVPVYDIGVDSAGHEYFTMKRASGRSLDAVLERLHYRDESMVARYTLPVRLGIFRQMCQGVEYAHECGIVHRDLKPENVMVGDLGETYLLDWGIAKVLDGSEAIELPEGEGAALLGTPGYMAPEQIRNAEAVGPAADVYALGAILYQLLTLEPLHAGDDVEDLLESTRAGIPADRMRERLAQNDVPPELAHACVQATRTDLTERLKSVSELLAMVAAYLDGDRDWRLRKELAAQHALAAFQALRTLLAQGDPSGEQRALALSEAGHALALDPKCVDAVHVITELFGHPPEKLPNEAAEILDTQRMDRAMLASRGGLLAYAAIVPVALSLLFFVHIYNWLAVIAMVAPMLVAIGINRYYALRLGRKAPALPIATAVLCAIAATSTLVGPYLIMPAFLSAYATVAIGHNDELIERPWTWALVSLLACAVPMLLLEVDLLPLILDFQEGGRVVLQHQVSDASPTVMRATLTGATLVAVFLPMLFAYLAARGVHRARRQMAIQLWHLRKLTTGGTPMDKPPSESS